MLRTLFLQAPSFDGFDGGAGSRYQARREIRSFWYPAWLAQPAALVPGSRLVDATPAGLHLKDVLPRARDFDLRLDARDAQIEFVAHRGASHPLPALLHPKGGRGDRRSITPNCRRRRTLPAWRETRRADWQRLPPRSCAGAARNSSAATRN